MNGHFHAVKCLWIERNINLTKILQYCNPERESKYTDGKSISLFYGEIPISS